MPVFCQRAAGAITLGIALSLASPAGYTDTLRDIYELALKNDAKLQAAAATYRANLETEQQAKSRLLPQINADASYTRTRQTQDSEGIDVEPTGDSANPFAFSIQKEHTNLDTRNRAWGVNLSQQLFDLPSWFSFKSGKELSKQAEAQFGADQQDLIVRTADAYFNVLRQWDNLQVSKSEELTDKRQLDQAQQRFEVGLTAITDVHEARAAFDASVAQRLSDEGALATAYEALTQLTGQEHANLWRLNREFPVVDPTPSDRAEWVQFALDNNFNLKAARYAADAASENASAKRAEHLPKVTGSLGYQDNHISGSQNSSPPSLFTLPPGADTSTRTAALTMTLPLYSGGYTSSQQRQAYEQYNAALERRIDTERSVVQNTRAQHIAATTDVQRTHARAQSIISAQSALDATRAGYEVGTRNIVDVLQSQRLLFVSLRDYANARYDYVMDLLRLKQQAGTLSPQDIQDLNRWLVAPESPLASSYTELEH